MKPGHYTALLKFFRSTSFNIDILYRKLITVCMNILPPKTIDGKVILVGDHIKMGRCFCRLLSGLSRLPLVTRSLREGAGKRKEGSYRVMERTVRAADA
jgi:hypothetical protein